jgi:hypothetical protein
MSSRQKNYPKKVVSEIVLTLAVMICGGKLACEKNKGLRNGGKKQGENLRHAISPYDKKEGKNRTSKKCLFFVSLIHGGGRFESFLMHRRKVD